MADRPLGRFCWLDLMTTEPGAAKDFYEKVAGWGTVVDDAGGQPYTMWMNGPEPIGGVMDMPPQAAAAGAPPSWMAHVSTPDLEATMAKAEELGATIEMSKPIPGVGSFAVISDPQGAVFAAFEPEGDAPGHDGPANVGEFSWHELATDDWEAAWAFYSELFEWEKTGEFDRGEAGMYHMFGRNGQTLGGMYGRMPEMPVNAWLYYVRVPDVEAAVTKVKELGGQVLNGPMEVPGGDTVAACVDPQGAAFAVHMTAAA